MLKRSDVSLSKSQIYDFMLEGEYTNFLTMQEVFFELRNQNLILEEKEQNRTFLKLSSEGEQTLLFFLGHVDAEIRLSVDRFLEENKLRIRDESSILADYQKTSDGQYEVSLQIKEMGQSVFELKLPMPTEEMAENLCYKWKEKSHLVYQNIVESLLK